jgi:hypothetical protein
MPMGMPQMAMPMPGYPSPQYGRVPSTPYPNQPYPAPGYSGQPVANNWNPALQPAQRSMPVMASMATAVPKTIPLAPPAPTRPPVIRLQAPETLLATRPAAPTPAAPIAMPSPEALGIR